MMNHKNVKSKTITALNQDYKETGRYVMANSGKHIGYGHDQNWR